MTAAENWSSDQEEDALPMDMDNSEDEVSVDTNDDEVMVVTEGVNCTLRDDFLQYVSKMTHNATNYTKREEVCIRLLITLRHTKASLDTYSGRNMCSFVFRVFQCEVSDDGPTPMLVTASALDSCAFSLPAIVVENRITIQMFHSTVIPTCQYPITNKHAKKKIEIPTKNPVLYMAIE